MPVAATTKPLSKTIDLAALFASRVRQVTILQHEGDDLWVKYKPDALDRKLQAAIKVAEGEEVAAMLLIKLLTDWNLTVDGESLPITVENLETLGLALLATIAVIVQEDFETNVQMGKPTTTALLAD